MEISSDRTPVVTIGITDPNGLPVHPDGPQVHALLCRRGRETTGQTNYSFSTVQFPTDVRNCEVCHGEGKESDVATVHSGIHYSDNTVTTET